MGCVHRVVQTYSDSPIPNYHHIVAVYHERTNCTEFASVEPPKRWARGAIMKICVLALSVNSITQRRSPVWSSSLAQCDLFTFMVKWGMSWECHQLWGTVSWSTCDKSDLCKCCSPPVVSRAPNMAADVCWEVWVGERKQTQRVCHGWHFLLSVNYSQHEYFIFTCALFLKMHFMTHCNVFSVDILISSVKENHKSTQFTIKCTVVSLNQNNKNKSLSLMCHEEAWDHGSCCLHC